MVRDQSLSEKHPRAMEIDEVPPLGSRDLGAGGPQGLHFPGMDGTRREGPGRAEGPARGAARCRLAAAAKWR